jgi:predicted transcriptional regulator YdeE
MEDIGMLWNKFYTEDIASKVTNKVDDSVISLYTEYKSDFTKPYTCMVGCPVINATNIAQSLTIKSIPKAKYAVFTAKSKAPEDVFAVWQYVWGSSLERTYTGDFEVYSPSAQEVEIYIAIK